MSSELSNGYFLPQNGDFGVTWFVDLERNIQRLNDHNHDGTNSSAIPSTAIAPVIIDLPVSAFTASPEGFSANLTTTSNINLDTRSFYVRDAVTKQQAFLDVVRVDALNYTVSTNTLIAYEVVLG